MLTRRILSAVVLLTSLTAAPLLAAQGDPRPSLDLTNPASVAALLDSLGDDQYARRQSGQSLLDTVPTTQVEQLKQLTAQATDPEIKSRLQRRLDALQHILETDPVPISLDLKDASLADLAAALTKATGVPTSALPGAAKSNFTLKTDPKPYWEIMQTLWKQHPFWYQDDTTQLQDGPPPMPNVHISEGACLMLSDIATGPAISDTQTSLHADLAIAIDPRLTLFYNSGGVGSVATGIVLQKVCDEHGRPIAAKLESVTGPLLKSHDATMTHGPVSNAALTLTAVGKPTHVTVAGTLTLIVVTGEATAELPNAGENLPQTFDFNVESKHLEVTLHELTIKKNYDTIHPHMLDIAILPHLKPGTFPPPAPAAPADRPPLRDVMIARLYDHNAKLIWTGETDARHEQAGIHDKNVNGTFEGPFKLVISSPTLRVWNIPFEFKDVPVK